MSDIIDQIDRSLLRNVRQINGKIDSKELAPHLAISDYREFWDYFKLIDFDGQSPETKMKALARLEVLAGSLKNHLDIDPDEFEGLAEVLSRLSNEVDHLARGSYYSQWLHEEDTIPICYTPHSGERYFAETARDTEVALKEIHKRLRNLFESDDWDFVEISKEITLSTKKIRDISSIYRKYGQFDEPYSLGRDWFLVFRQYLGPFNVKGKRIKGPNPAHLPSWPIFDISMGLTNKDYINAVFSREDAYLKSDWDLITNETQTTNFCHIILNKLMVNHDWTNVENIDSEALANDIFQAAGEPMHSGLVIKFAQLCRALQQLSSVHWAAIMNNLVRPAEAISSSTKLSSEDGVSGTPLSATKNLLYIRRNAALPAAFIQSAQMLSALE